MCTIDILGVSHRKHEVGDMTWLRENGQPAFNFVHFVSPAAIVIDGATIITENNACILYTPGHRQEYSTYKGLLINDYVTFRISDTEFRARLDLPLNQVFYVHKGDEITNRLEWIAWAVADKTEPHGDDIVNAVLELFAVLPSLRVDNSPGAKRLYETKQRFVALREEMRKSPGHWTVDEMAGSVWLTRSRFSVLYAKFFGISPNADLMNMKIKYAISLLMTTDDSVTSISRICGYDSVEYFIRMFKAHTKKTPLQYRKENM